ncbi:glycoside hydrolase family 10 protein [Oxalobacteraceae bacterium A2-2]
MVLVFNAKRRMTLAAAGSGALAMLLDGCSSTPTVPAPVAGAMPPPAGLPGAAPTPAPASSPADGFMPPPAPREFRAAWVSTVANIDWPSRNNLSMEKQQAEALAILERARLLNLNAIVLQVRPSADAIYPSQLEPWSEFLTGAQGRPPKTAWDPLQFWIEQAHLRGLELHAWFNPYRARHATARTPLAPGHIAKTKPETVKTYGRYLWMDPGEPAASQHTLDVVLDVVRRYDIDGVHIDDYFYPYPIDAPNAAGPEGVALDGGVSGAQKPELEFPDQPSWQRYLLGGGQLDRASWRRQNVNNMIEQLYLGIRKEKSWVRFGVSPFGIGRPDKRPPGIVGFSQYDKLYADAELWLSKGWLDYLAPQLYWPVSQTPQAFDVLLDYWLAQNSHARHVWPGLYTSRIDAATKAYAPEEIVKQIAVTRSRGRGAGHLHFSIAPLMENRKGISDQLRARAYQSAALVPPTPWLGSEAPGAPKASCKRAQGGLAVELNPGGGKPVAQYAIWTRYGSEWRFAVAPAARPVLLLQDDASGGAANAVVVSAVDRLGNESERVTVLR